MNEQNKPSYYAIIPSEVRYCEELKYSERLLYGEITALAGKEGYCFATNKYFAELYNVIPGTISRWISHLENLGFVQVQIIKDEKKQVIERRIYINNMHRDFLASTYKQNKQYPISKKEQYNNINNRIDRFFYYIIRKEGRNPEKFTSNEEIEFNRILERIELNYTEEIIKIFTKENIEKLKIIIYALKELFFSSKRNLIQKATREELIFVYDNCKDKKIEYQGSEKEINNFFEYYYISLIRDLEKY